MVRSLSLSLCLVDGRRRFLFGFSRGRNSLEFYAREDEEDDEWVVVRAPARRDDDDGEVSSEVADDEAEKRSRDLRFRVARVREIFLSFYSPQI